MEATVGKLPSTLELEPEVVASTSHGWSWAERRRTCWEEELLLTVLRD